MFYDIHNKEKLHGFGRQHHECGHRRHGHGHRGGGHFGQGRRELTSGRKFTAVDLQLVILALLDAKPAHGYELIKSLEERSDGFYTPSPGVIYPALTYLEEIGYALVETIGTKKLYTLTDVGRTYLESSREVADRIVGDLERIGGRMADTRRAFDGEAATDVQPPMVKDSDTLLAAIKNRRSMGLSRLRPDAEVDVSLIAQMLEAANWAPSHGDTEPWRYTVFTGGGRDRLADLFEAGHGDEGARKRAYAAPVWISIGMQPARREDGRLVMSEEEELLAVACSVQNMHLMASSLGLAGMWHSKGLSVHSTVASGLGLEPPARLLGFFACGWPATEVLTSTRRPMSDKVTWFG